MVASEHGPTLRRSELSYGSTVIDDPLIGHEEPLEDAVAGEYGNSECADGPTIEGTCTLKRRSSGERTVRQRSSRQ